MRHQLGLTAIGVLLAVMPLAHVNAQTNLGQQGTLIVCPAWVAIDIRSTQVPQGWSSQWSGTSNFMKAEIMSGAGYRARNLTCSYSMPGRTDEVGRLGQNEPTGMLCSVNLAKPNQFDCYPKPVSEMLGQAAQTSGPGPAGGGASPTGIGVVSATYGGNCGGPEGNVTAHLAGACNGKSSCGYSVDYKVIGDPAPGCKKDYVAKWKCGGGSEQTARAEAEAGFGSAISLTCQ